MLTRVSSAAIGLPLLLGIVWIGDPVFLLLGLAATVLGLREFFGLAEGAGGEPVRAMGYVLGPALMAGMWRFGADAVVLILALGGILGLVGAVLRFQEGRSDTGWLWMLGGLVYVPLLLGHFLWLRASFGWQWVLLAMLSTFAVDTAAYGVGRAVGRHKLAPHLSPGKTREGAAGGMAGAIIATPLLAGAFSLPLGIPAAVLLGILVGIAAQAGDLAESYLKRSAHAKDAGALIPGHGGLLDRLDSLVFVGPVVYYYAVWMLGAE